MDIYMQVDITQSVGEPTSCTRCSFPRFQASVHASGMRVAVLATRIDWGNVRVMLEAVDCHPNANCVISHGGSLVTEHCQPSDVQHVMLSIVPYLRVSHFLSIGQRCSITPLGLKYTYGVAR